MPPSNLNLALMNLFVGMCKGLAGLPRNFRTLQYVDKWIELRFANTDQEQVAPELIVSSRRLNHTILFEWKSGPNFEADQLRRYSRVTQDDLRERAVLAVEETGSHDVAVIGLQEHAERLTMGIAQGPYTFPLLLVTDDGLAIHQNRFQPNETDAVFRPLLAIDWGKVPNHFFPVDVDSELWEFAELVIPKVLELMGKGEARILPRDLEETILCWNVLSRDYQRQLRTKLCDTLDRACQRQFEPYIRRNRDRGAGERLGRHWDIIDNPIAGSSDRRAKEWKKLGSLYKQFVEFLRTGRNVPEQQELNLGDDA
jgi:hypothetical protein